MSKEDLIELKGTVTEVGRNNFFLVKLDNGHIVKAYSSGKIRKHKIKIVPGDEVMIELSPLDLERGRISLRLGGTKTEKPKA